MRSATKRQSVHFDPVIISEVINLSKNLRKHSDAKHSKTPRRNGVIRASDIPVYPADTKDEDVLAYRAAKDAFIEYLSGLSITMVKDIMALMYLGRNGCFDGICLVPVHKRLSIYENSHCFRDDEKDKMIIHMAEKSRLLGEYLEDVLRFINEPKCGKC